MGLWKLSLISRGGNVLGRKLLAWKLIWAFNCCALSLHLLIYHFSFFLFFWHFYCICHADFWSRHCSFCRHQSQKLIYMVQHSSLWHPSEISRNTTAMFCVLVVSRLELSGGRRGCHLIFVRYSVCLVMFRRDRLLYFLYAVGWKAAFYPAHRKCLVMKMSEFLHKINSFLFFIIYFSWLVGGYYDLLILWAQLFDILIGWVNHPMTICKR